MLYPDEEWTAVSDLYCYMQLGVYLERTNAWYLRYLNSKLKDWDLPS